MLLPGKKPILSIGNWPVYVTPSARYGTAGLFVVLSAVALLFTDLTPLDAIIAGALLTLIHWMGDLVHQYGHKLAADFVGHPSTGLSLWFIIGTTLYPDNEGSLPSRVHIQRALGGPLLSLLSALPLGLLALWMWPMGGMAQLLIGFALFEALPLFGLGALFPLHLPQLGYQSDGSIILRELRKA